MDTPRMPRAAALRFREELTQLISDRDYYTTCARELRERAHGGDVSDLQSLTDMMQTLAILGLAVGSILTTKTTRHMRRVLLAAKDAEIARLVEDWQLVAHEKRLVASYGADDVERRARAQGYAEALLAACAELSERLDDLPSDQDTALLTDLRRHIKRIESSLADAQHEIDTVLRRLGERS